MTTNRRWAWLALAIALAIALAVAWRMTCSNRQAVLRAGQEVTIAIRAPEAHDLYGYELKLHYDQDALEYVGPPLSDIADMPTIFARTDRGDYLLVGATMLGDQPGVSGQDMAVCRLTFRALRDIDRSELGFRLEEVNLVQGGLYDQGVEGWTLDVQ